MEKKFKIRKDDQVEIIAGKDKGKRGNIIRVIRDKDRVIVAGCNIVKKAMKKPAAYFKRSDRMQKMRSYQNRI